MAFTLARGNCSVEHGIKNISAVLSFYPQCLEVSTKIIKKISTLNNLVFYSKVTIKGGVKDIPCFEAKTQNSCLDFLFKHVQGADFAHHTGLTGRTLRSLLSILFY